MTAPSAGLNSILSPGFMSPSWFPFHSPFTFRAKNGMEMDLDSGLAHFTMRPSVYHSTLPGLPTPLKERGNGKEKSNSLTALDSGLFHSNDQATSGGSTDTGRESFVSMSPASPPYSARFQSATSPYATFPTAFPIDMESRVSVMSAIEIYARRNEQAARITMEQTLPKLLQDCSHILQGLKQEVMSIRSSDDKLKSSFRYSAKAPSRVSKTTFGTEKSHGEGKMDHPGSSKQNELNEEDECFESKASGASSSPLKKRPRHGTNDNTSPPNPDSIARSEESCPIDTRGAEENHSHALEQTQRVTSPTIATSPQSGTDVPGKKRKRSFEPTVEPL